MDSPARAINWPDTAFYHLLYDDKYIVGAENLLHALTSLYSMPGNARVLHAGCSSGMISRQLADLGFEVTALDPSAANIESAITGDNTNPEFFIHDMRLPFRGSYFDLALCLFRGFGQYRTRREHDDVMRTLASSLRQGARLVIDFPNVHYEEEHLVSHETIIRNETTFEIHRRDDADSFHTRITVRDPSLALPEVFDEKLIKFSLGDFNDMLSYQGLQVLQVYGDYQLNPYHVRNSQRLIVVAQKKSTLTS